MNFEFLYIFVFWLVRASTRRALALILPTVRSRAHLQVKGDRPEVMLEQEEAVQEGVHRVEAEELEVKDGEQAGLRPENNFDILRVENLQAQRIADEQVAYPK